MRDVHLLPREHETDARTPPNPVRNIRGEFDRSRRKPGRVLSVACGQFGRAILPVVRGDYVPRVRSTRRA